MTAGTLVSRVNWRRIVGIEWDREITWKTRILRFVARYCMLGSVLALIGALMPFAATYHWQFDKAAHFTIQYFACALVAVVPLGAMRKWKWAVPGIAALAITAPQILPWYVPPAMASGGPRAFRMLIVNVLTSNTEHDRLIALVEREQPDLIVLQEIDGAWVESMRALDGQYPNSEFAPREDNFGIGFMSRLPVEKTRVQDVEGVPIVRAWMTVGGQALQIFAMHTLPPGSRQGAEMRNRQLEYLGTIAPTMQRPFIVAGDLNSTMWSPYYTRMIERADVKEARRGFGLVPTWPTWIPFMQIPIDHCLYAGPLEVLDFRRGPSFGSDHYPLIVDFAFAPEGAVKGEAA